MATRSSKAKISPVFLVSRNWQLAFVAMTILSWIVGIATMFIWASTGYTSVGTWTYQITQSVVPLLWFLGALWFVWSRYKARLHKVFAASFVTVVGYGIFAMASSLENTLHYRFYPPVIKNINDNSLLTAFGHDWLVMSIGLAIFVGLIIWKKYVRKGH
jgi:hypothetical protein